MPKKLAGKKRLFFLSNMAAIRGEKTPLKIFSVNFVDMTNPHKNVQHSKRRNGEKKVSDFRVPLT